MKEKVKYILLLSIIVTFISGAVFGQRCRARSYGKNNIVCVCDAVYCDSISAPEKLLKTGHYLQYTSTLEGLRAEPKVFSTSRKAPVSTRNLCKVNSSVQYQEMLGFGGGLTDSVGINLGTLSPAVSRSLLRQYFGPSGINYTFVRYPMGGTDFSTRFYTYDDGPPDVTLKRFRLAAEDYKYKLPYLKYIYKLSPNTKTLAVPWSPPEWMMEPRNESVGYSRLRNMFYQQNADYFVRFLKEFQNQGFKVWAVSPQNEPGNGYYVYFGINSCGYSPEEQLDFITNYLCPTLQGNGYGDVLIMNNDDQRKTFPYWPDMILGDPKGNKCVNGTAVHWYYDPETPASLLTDLHNKYRDKFILYTEASYIPADDEPAVQFGNWGRLEQLCSDMIDVFNHRAAGWVDWNMVLDLTGGPTYLGNNLDAAIIVNSTSDEFYKQPIFYCLAHFSKFVPPESKCISLQSTANNAEIVGFLRPDNIIATVILNRNDTDQNIVLQSEDGGYMPIKVPAHSLHTVLYRK